MARVKRAMIVARLATLFCAAVPALVAAQPLERPPTICMANSPERRGEEGCTILASRPLVVRPNHALFWHIDRHASLDAARAAAGPDSVAAEAHGGVWLLTVERQTSRRHSGQHVGWIGPLAPLTAGPYTMRVQSTRLLPGGGTPVHIHSGPEVFFIVSGAQCVETQARAHRLETGASLMLPGDTVHRGRVLGAVPRQGLALVLHDATRRASHDLAVPPQLVGCG